MEMIHKEYSPSNLLKPTTVFVDTTNIVFYSDAQVLYRLIRILVNDSASDFLQMFHSLVEAFGQDRSFEKAIELSHIKESQNILLDYVDWGEVRHQTGETDVINYCDMVYRNLLYQSDFLKAPYQPTSIGNALKFLTKDRNLTKLICYSGHLTNALCDALTELMSTGSDKIMVIGDVPIDDAIKQNDADIYFLNEFQLIEAIISMGKTKHRELIIPARPYNTIFYSDGIGTDTDSEIKYYSNFDIDVNFIRMPI